MVNDPRGLFHSTENQPPNRECREHDVPAPVWDFGAGGLMLTLRANPEHVKAAPASTPKTTPITTSENLLALIREKPDRSQGELADALGLTRDGDHPIPHRNTPPSQP